MGACMQTTAHAVDDEAEGPWPDSSSAGGLPAGVGRAAFHDDYVVTRRLGQGAFASVYEASRRRCDGQSSEGFAVKVLGFRSPRGTGESGEGEAPPRKQQHAVEREVSTMRALPRSVHLVRLYDSYLGEDGLSYLVLERCSMSLWTLLQRIPHLTEQKSRVLFLDMFKALAACHAACVVHRDVKPDNFLASVGGSQAADITVKLCDFGLAARIPSPEARTLTRACGTAPYLAPEVLKKEAYGAEVDMWAIGVMVYVLHLGRWPYMPAEPTPAAMKAAILAAEPAPSFRPEADGPRLSKACTGLARALLCDPSERLSAREALGHGWFRPRADHGLEGESLRPTIDAARCLGAFSSGAGGEAPTELDMLMAQLNSQHQAWQHPKIGHRLRSPSEISTDVGSDRS